MFFIFSSAFYELELPIGVSSYKSSNHGRYVDFCFSDLGSVSSGTAQRLNRSFRSLLFVFLSGPF